MISEVKMQEKYRTTKIPRLCPNILSADADADAGGIAIALLH